VLDTGLLLGMITVSKRKLDLVGMSEAKWDKVSIEEWCLLGCYAVKTSNLTRLALNEQVNERMFLFGKGSENHKLGRGCCCFIFLHKRII
jgi:hypothetical protein